MSVALELRDVSVSYGTGRNRFAALSDISLQIPVGTTLGLVGESGSGKSTLGRAVVGTQELSGGTISIAESTRVGVVLQNPRASFNPRMTVRNAILEAWETVPEAERRYSRAEVVGQLLERVGLEPDAMHRWPHEFSGGQLQRIALARTLAAQPDLIVLDEVTSALDLSVQASILALLREVQAELALTYLFISHDLAVVAQMADTVAVLYVGRLVELGPVSEVMASPSHPYTAALLHAAPRLDAPPPEALGPSAAEIPDPRDPPPGCPYWTRCAQGPLVHPEREICVAERPQLLPVLADGPVRAACHFSSETTDPSKEKP